MILLFVSGCKSGKLFENRELKSQNRERTGRFKQLLVFGANARADDARSGDYERLSAVEKNGQALAKGENIHAHRAQGLRFAMYHSANLLGGLAAESHIAAAGANAGGDVFNKYRFAVNHE